MGLTTFDMMKQIKPDLEGIIVLDEEQVRALQQVLLSMLDDIVECCEKHRIRYTLGGGSVLGALRHKGFIPWDDDIDINMPRADYERFVRFFRMEYSDRYWLHTPRDTHDLALPMAKVRKKGTVLRERDDFHNNECGVAIDIFIIENTYDQPLKRRIHGTGSMGLLYLLSCRKFFRDRKELMRLAKSLPKVPSVFRFKIASGAVLAVLPTDVWCRMADRWNGKCKNDHSVYVSGAGGRLHFFGELYKRADFVESRKAEFEGRSLNVPKKAEEYLTHCYGDWKKIPKESEREKHIVFEFKL